ncbi:GNAT family N-acetyltransferase [Clostridium beijerinckii]|uniref:GNAT family N-acetyltransferase n=1 Tax=Clostridium beijerinckii TaxID=1520 RepID=UPI0006843BD1|nr:GNAT family N-acetyltransferase [Clostridium beijerinckii]
MTEEIYVRDINNGDFETLTELIKQLGYPSTLSKVSDRLSKINSSKNYKTFVAEVSGKVVGFIGLSKLYAYEYDGDYVRIVALIVSEQYRGKGIGSKLVEAAEKWALEENSIAVSLNSGINRKEANSFYESIGYSIKGYSFSKSII